MFTLPYKTGWKSFKIERRKQASSSHFIFKSHLTFHVFAPDTSQFHQANDVICLGVTNYHVFNGGVKNGLPFFCRPQLVLLTEGLILVYCPIISSSLLLSCGVVQTRPTYQVGLATHKPSAARTEPWSGFAGNDPSGSGQVPYWTGPPLL